MRIIVDIEYDPDLACYEVGMTELQACQYEADIIATGDMSIDEFIRGLDWTVRVAE